MQTYLIFVFVISCSNIQDCSNSMANLIVSISVLFVIMLQCVHLNFKFKLFIHDSRALRWGLLGCRRLEGVLLRNGSRKWVCCRGYL